MPDRAERHDPWHHRRVRILVLEDDLDVQAAIDAELARAGFAVDVATTIGEADAAVAVNQYDCLVLDRMTPDGDSLQHLGRWRSEGVHAPALFLSALDQVEDRVAGFESGGDDYLGKPFAMAELVVRVRRLCRTSQHAIPSALTFDDIIVDTARRSVERGGVTLVLRNKELAILELLLRQPGVVVSKESLVEHCWGERTDPLSNTVEAHMSSLRRKLGDPAVIQTIRGVGYVIGAAA